MDTAFAMKIYNLKCIDFEMEQTRGEAIGQAC